ncbi:MAG: hypothetical protein KC931_21060, partial [Candidatus Omnitrophica bacterium]|nr:hypothetical protein [Candidatus Omnitrophota bacterium]
MTLRQLICLSIIAVLLPTGVASAEFRAYDAGLVFSRESLIQAIDPSTGIPSVPAEYSTCPNEPPNSYASLILGMAYIGSTLYGLDWMAQPDIHLVTLDTTLCATSTQVSGSPMGFTDLLSLAYCTADGFLYSADFDSSAQTGSLVRIDPTTGVGTKIGEPMALDVRVVGMTYDPAVDTLFALTNGHGSREPELLTIDRSTGVETPIGFTGTDPTTVFLQSLALDQSVTPARLIAGEHLALREIDRTTGTAGERYGGPGYAGILWALANPDPGLPGPTATPGGATPTYTPVPPTATVTPTTTPPEPTSTRSGPGPRGTSTNTPIGNSGLDVEPEALDEY